MYSTLEYVQRTGGNIEVFLLFENDRVVLGSNVSDTDSERKAINTIMNILIPSGVVGNFASSIYLDSDFSLLPPREMNVTRELIESITKLISDPEAEKLRLVFPHALPYKSEADTFTLYHLIDTFLDHLHLSQRLTVLAVPFRPHSARDILKRYPKIKTIGLMHHMNTDEAISLIQERPDIQFVIFPVFVIDGTLFRYPNAVVAQGTYPWDQHYPPVFPRAEWKLSNSALDSPP